MDLKDKVAVITGGSSGLGRATVKRFVANGAKAVIFDMNEEKGQQLVDEFGGSVIFCNVNVTSEESVQAGIAAAMDAFGAIHICCNFAGTGNAIRTMGKKGPFPLDEFNKIIQINLVGTFNVLRLCAEKMSDNEVINDDGGRGVIINTASVAAYEGQVGQAAYSASKGGVVGMTLPIARDLSVLGIRVNTIVPGLIATPLMMGGAEEMTPEIAEFLQPLASQVLYPKRLGKADEIAQLAQQIAENDYINGECIRMDGGIRMQPK
ncbi:SDR family NAD(P)-dependent oxidoreductase [Candidatus Marimicrobium litorale]|uniref:SDR family NAD(P)-dependent oxidoreductase n=1 Tax=Candidatus Marimicrobium litorale TaxID=2518991 RepID=A0ABT3T1J0_9GAMM|nr:SDR family NAD(P)-dependent oxidoreductase [Candidatus Marimicrobium litorale]MCP4211985.1 SDR family NAD(P)-dependent oxidoreductase [Halieaceae bacterium]MDC0361493.1 SDR family NAD(P)-dependent oxidoreductase [Halioglobus sp.]MCP4468886.1 SDR family NAD(P)-dependent oxidoreductase [Halieaceae bacterium]MCX2976113.1 SDR family NAD(P)-dependent oxidoreductase [Candidatus Marimicrobium litorale]MDG2412833.1 SDR family NAD(P)-dependent oxidoreductase [Halioglobus sp.]